MHVEQLGLHLSDEAIWDAAARMGLVIVSKDSDFQQRSLVRGHPPKVIWIRLGNCKRGVVESLLRLRCDDIARLVEDEVESLLALP